MRPPKKAGALLKEPVKDRRRRRRNAGRKTDNKGKADEGVHGREGREIKERDCRTNLVL